MSVADDDAHFLTGRDASAYFTDLLLHRGSLLHVLACELPSSLWRGRVRPRPSSDHAPGAGFRRSTVAARATAHLLFAAGATLFVLG